MRSTTHSVIGKSETRHAKHRQTIDKAVHLFAACSGQTHTLNPIDRL